MERSLRPLAIAVVIVEVCVALFTVPVLYVYLFLFIEFRELFSNSVTIQALTITGLTLTFVLGILAAVIAAQHGHCSWSIAFVILLALFAYSPLFLAEVAQSPGFLADSANFNLNTPTYAFIELSNRILPAIILAMVVLVYSLRYRHMSSQRQDATLQIERSQIK
jgi:hypothetical protein